MKVIVTPEDPRQLEGQIEQTGVVNVVVTYVETADTPVGEGEPATITTAGASFHCRVQETPRPEIVVVEDLDGRSVLDNAHSLGD